MVLNDFKKDTEDMLKESGLRKIEVCRRLGLGRSNYYDIPETAQINDRYVLLIEALGYDMRVEYIKGAEGIVNDFKRDVRELVGERKKSEIAQDMGISRQLLNSYITSANITRRFVSLCKVLGYGLEVTYLKK